MVHVIITTANIADAYDKRRGQYIESIERCLSYRHYFDSYTVLECVSDHEDYLDNYNTYYSELGNPYHDKGHNEVSHLKAFLQQSGLPDNISIIKISGKYLLTDSYFFDRVIEFQADYDSMFKNDNDVYVGNGYHTFLYYAKKGLLLDVIESIDLNDANNRPIEWDFKEFLMVRDNHIEIDRLGIMAHQGANSEKIFYA
ncbi:hypothetical protein INP83_01435 [Mucilaginibacter sp. 21P]|uniref:hypothetical protein n=1 Tax=Mucilaginibacter sp. 21P TaxID=2778902 RepID=UPI001C578E8D|nr:hypothetical protein [Mucilaginibacter sp. 21P]QXV65787.1 hypothetical protein INP83_01435 [Mucilaginibacter sp. 21P]